MQCQFFLKKKFKYSRKKFMCERKGKRGDLTMESFKKSFLKMYFLFIFVSFVFEILIRSGENYEEVVVFSAVEYDCI